MSARRRGGPEGALPLQVLDHASELVGQGAGPVLGKRGGEAAVVPERLLAGRPEAVEDLVAMRAVVEQDRAGVVDLVGQRDAQLVFALGGDGGDVGLLALLPWRLRRLEG